MHIIHGCHFGNNEDANKHLWKNEYSQRPQEYHIMKRITINALRFLFIFLKYFFCLKLNIFFPITYFYIII